MNKLGKQRVPYEGPIDEYDLLVVGEAPGKVEEAQGRPFVGRSGQVLRGYLKRAGYPIRQVRFANLCKYRPEDNNFRHCLKTPQLEEGLNTLEEEINRVKPNVVLGVGAWPLWFLTGECGRQKRGKKEVDVPGTGIMSYRGSRLPMLSRFGGGKYHATFHPSFVARAWQWNPVFYFDIKNAIEESKTPELVYPEYDSWINPDHAMVEELLLESLDAEWISTDIETFPNGTFSCIGWSWRLDGRDRAVTITKDRPDLWNYLQRMWESKTKKILQFGTFDHSFMEHFYGWQIQGYHGVGWDTYVASANIYPDFPRGLDFLCSMYTRFPYYKDDRKVWKESEDIEILWNYNIKDCVATMGVALGQMEDIRRLYGVS